MPKESLYDFRKRLLEVHKKGIRNHNLLPGENEFEIKNNMKLVIPLDATEVIKTATYDFKDYMKTSMEVTIEIVAGTPDDGDIYAGVSKNSESELKNAASYKGFKAFADSKITLLGYDDRGVAQGLYFLEDEMSVRKAPFIEKRETLRKPIFAPRMVHSGYGLDDYPDEHLQSIAHSGRDAILVFVKDVNETPTGHLDFNDLTERAARYGLDVYAYSYLHVYAHPDSPEADKAFEDTYGALFKSCPKLKGVVLVGESVRFESRDPNVRDISKDHSYDQRNSEEKDPRPDPGWWPCLDYADWVKKLKDTVNKYNPDADIVFWTYNFSHAPEEARHALIERLPEGITLLTTFKAGHRYKLEDVTELVCDYTISFPGPGKIFKSDARAAAKKGIRLYAMTNTAGTTWDMGTVPYIPAPYQWLKRYEGMLEANRTGGLCGLMESHHFGFNPSFISDFSNLALCHTGKSPEEILTYVLTKHYGAENTDEIKEALHYWSDGISHFIPTDDDQYGPFRVGPAYPLMLYRRPDFKLPCNPKANFGNRIVCHYYSDFEYIEKAEDNSIILRMEPEIHSLEKALACYEKGLEVLNGIPSPCEELERLINLGKYITCYIKTGINTKKWFVEKNKLIRPKDRQEIEETFKTLYAILEEEYVNAESAIPVLEKDSRLGWEPSMEYIGHKDNILWKLKQLEYVRDVQLPTAYKRYMPMEN